MGIQKMASYMYRIHTEMPSSMKCPLVQMIPRSEHSPIHLAKPLYSSQATVCKVHSTQVESDEKHSTCNTLTPINAQPRPAQ